MRASADPLSEEFQREAEEALSEAAGAAEFALLAVVCDRVASVGPEDSAADALASWGADLARAERALGDGRRDALRAALAMLASLEEANAEWAAPLYAAAGASMSEDVAERALAECRERIEKALAESMSTSAVGLATDDGRVLPFREAYVAAVSRAATSMAVGDEARAAAVSGAVRSLCEGGARVVYVSGATRELQAAVTQAVAGEFRRAAHASRWAMAREFGADGVEISAHALCADDHLPYQGRTFSMREYEEVNASLPRPLVDGANCRHIAFPVLLGVSEPSRTPEEVEALREASQRRVKVRVGGGVSEMTRYEATQLQRRYERAIRHERTVAAMLDREGLDASDAQESARSLLARYRHVSEDADLDTRPERTRVLVRSDLV